MVSEGIDDSSDAPTVGLVGDGPDDAGPGCNLASEDGIGIVHDHHHAHRTTAQRLGTEVQVLGGLVRDPELGCSHRQLSDYLSAIIIEAEQLAGSECCLVELDRLCAAAN